MKYSNFLVYELFNYIIIYLKLKMQKTLKFSDLGLDNWLLKNIKCLEYTNPTPVQEKVIPQILKPSSIKIGRASCRERV